MINRLLVGNITHLTDARFYAARGVYGMAYRYDRADLEHLARIQEMMDWVEGPKRFLDLRYFSTEPYPALSNYDGFIGDQKIGDEDFEKIRVHNHDKSPVILQQFTKADIQNITRRTYCLLHNQNAEMLLTLAESNEYIYFFMEGEDEEAVGLKDYDALNDLLDRVQWG